MTKISVDDDFYKKLMKMISDLMTPEGQKKIMDFINSNPDFFKGASFVNFNPADLERFFNFLNNNPNIKLNISTSSNTNFPIPGIFQKEVNNSSNVVQKDEDEDINPECFWVEDEYHIVFNYPDDVLKFKTAVHKKDKSNIILRIINSEGKIIKRVKLPAIIEYKRHNAKYRNGIYEIIYKKAN
ncbi:MAG: hypothetical protein ACTSQO_00535 [Candidatus Helarchaeota archaeon]